MITTLTKTETAKFVNEIEMIYEQPITDGRRAPPKWVTKSFKERSLWERVASLELGSKKNYTIRPKNPNPPPTHNMWLERFWLSCAISPALIVQALWYHFVPENNYFHTWHPLFAFLFYNVTLIIFSLQQLHRSSFYMKYYGTFDEDKRPRDYIPDKLVPHLIIMNFIRLLSRTGGNLLLSGYDRHSPPSLGHTISCFFIVKIGLWLIALDFFFYSYHRTVHTVPFLWKMHSLHHRSKHPTPLQVSLGGHMQELIEMSLVPLVASLIVPLTAHEFWIGQCVLIYVEGGGHSGIRAYWPHVILYEVLRPFGMELCIEDHDLHHRFGKSGMNYGKQTRIFDRLFGTVHERIECVQK